jgi:hypothetical protein
MLEMKRIKVLNPYTQRWVIEEHPTLEKALARIKFYQSCGSPAQLI